MTIKPIHNRSDWYIASYTSKSGKHHFGIAISRLEALKDCLKSIYN